MTPILLSPSLLSCTVDKVTNGVAYNIGEVIFAAMSVMLESAAMVAPLGPHLAFPGQVWEPLNGTALALKSPVHLVSSASNDFLALVRAVFSVEMLSCSNLPAVFFIKVCMILGVVERFASYLASTGTALSGNVFVISRARPDKTDVAGVCDGL